jgi:UDP-N-acetylmuramate--alanine ligase
MAFEKKNIYFLGIGGIGMSALVRYFLSLGFNVAGYDKTPTELTSKLIDEGAQISFQDDTSLIPQAFQNEEETLVVRTPAVPIKTQLFQYFSNGFEVKKRSEILGIITQNQPNISVAGTHGKTTISSMIASCLHHNQEPFTAFLGGIANNLNSNYAHFENSRITVIEADEYDRSFLHLRPDFLVVSAIDPDHLDIYGTPEAMVETFCEFVQKNCKPEGVRLVQHKLKSVLGSNILTYGIEASEADYSVENIQVVDHKFQADFYHQGAYQMTCKVGLSGIHNLENALACFGILKEWGMGVEQIKLGLENYKGVQRRFDVKISSDKLTYIDDYAHHPEEIRQLVKSVRKLYPNKKVLGIFQPHLFSRTQDFAEGFAEVLSGLDECILLDIYPAREEPILGVTSKWLLDMIPMKSKTLCSKVDALTHLQHTDSNVVLSIGAGDIGMEVPTYQKVLQQKLRNNEA